MLLDYKLGQGSIVLRVVLKNSAVATGAGLTGLTSATSGLNIGTVADNEATSTAYTGGNLETITTLGTYATPTAGKARFKEVDATNHPGVYEIQLADARYGVSSAKSLLVSINGATGLAQCNVLVPLRTFDPYATGGKNPATLASTDVTGNIAADIQTIKTQTVTCAGGVTVPAATLASTTNITAGTIATVTNLTNAPTAGDFTSAMKLSLNAATPAVTVSDKTGFSLTQAFPSNFSSLLISGGGHISNVDTLTTYTGNTVQTGDSFARIGAAGVGLTSLAPANTALTTVTWTNALAANVGTTNATVAATLDATISSRLAAGSYTSPDNAGIAVAAAASASAATSAASADTKATAIKAKTDNLPSSPAAVGSAMTLTSAYDFGKGTVQMTEAYAANGVSPTPVQALFAIHQHLMSFVIAGTAYTVKKLDGATQAYVATLNDATNPTGETRA